MYTRAVNSASCRMESIMLCARVNSFRFSSAPPPRSMATRLRSANVRGRRCVWLIFCFSSPPVLEARATVRLIAQANPFDAANERFARGNNKTDRTPDIDTFIAHKLFAVAKRSERLHQKLLTPNPNNLRKPLNPNIDRFTRNISTTI